MLQIIADGLIIGSVVSLGAIGLSLTFSILRFSNFGHGELLAWGAYFALTLLSVFSAVGGAASAKIGPFSFGWPLLAALAGAAVLTALLILALDTALFKRLRRQGAITLVIASFGAALALRNLLLFFYGGVPQYYSQDLQIAVALVPRSVSGGMRMTPDQMLVLALTAVTVLGVHLFLKFSAGGRGWRVCRLDRAVAPHPRPGPAAAAVCRRHPGRHRLGGRRRAGRPDRGPGRERFGAHRGRGVPRRGGLCGADRHPAGQAQRPLR
jgi:branched-chain amino acid transport system permease protein